jgi:hypothetical protein
MTADKVVPVVGREKVIEHLTQLRNTLAHALTQPHISADRFNEIRAQLLPLDQQLRALGIDLAPTPQMNPNYQPHLTRAQRRQRHRASKYQTYEQRVQRKIAEKRG